MYSLIFFSLLSSAFYRLGGTSWGTKYRDWGVPTVMLWWFIFQGIENKWICLCWLLMFFAQTSYFKKDGTDARWHNWLLVGLAFSFALFPFSAAVGNIGGFVFRGLVVTAFTVSWSGFIGKAWLEEAGRGFIQIITLPLLLQ